MSGVADDDSAFLAMSGCGVISKARAIAALDGRLAKDAMVVTDQAAAYPGGTEALGVALTQTDAKDHAINRVNTLHSQLDGFLAGFKGVSMKRFGEYLTWFLWRRTYQQDRVYVTERQVNVTKYDNTVRDWAHVEPAYMDYWRAAAWPQRMYTVTIN